MPIDPFAVLNALLRAEAAHSSRHEAKAPTTAAPAPSAPTTDPATARPAHTPPRPSEARRDARDRS
ncbi:hypothetical protein [Streptomyces sp. NPDC058653]|uniref:hypothetical protein n=1 Tax=Streptomyces sp. NPDC058653 TaxID=3346576 RepID=UPI00365A5312